MAQIRGSSSSGGSNPWLFLFGIRVPGENSNADTLSTADLEINIYPNLSLNKIVVKRQSFVWILQFITAPTLLVKVRPFPVGQEGRETFHVITSRLPSHIVSLRRVLLKLTFAPKH